jgi:hypothetical protein
VKSRKGALSRKGTAIGVILTRRKQNRKTQTEEK